MGSRYRITISVDETLVVDIDELVAEDPRYRSASHFFEMAAYELYNRIQEGTESEEDRE